MDLLTDSSRRAVEAADNVVHAYDLNMQVPDTPNPPNDDDSMDAQSISSSNERRPSLLFEGKSVIFRKSKRHRTSESGSSGPAPKHRHLDVTNSTPLRDVSPHTVSLHTAIEGGENFTSGMEDLDAVTPALIEPEIALEFSEPESVAVTPGLRHTQVRDLLHLIVSESLRVGGRPESAVAHETLRGESIEVITRGTSGEPYTRIIEWSVDPQVPETVFGK